VARMGGDEFVLIVENLDDSFDAGHVAQKLHQAFRTPLLIDGVPLTISASIGISVYPDDGGDIETLMRQADMAMYEVKARGRDGWMFFTEQMNRSVQERLSLERDLRQALERREFHLHYQPQWDLESLRLIGWEALLRWDHPERGSVSPDIFIPVAEDTGIISELGFLVLHLACREAARWQREGLGRYGISVNLSARQFAVPDLEQKVDQALADNELDPDLLELEITETVMMENPRRTREALDHFRSRGIRVAIDDFGTGYSSLSYLGSFPIDRLKIDRSFVASSLDDPNGALIVEAVISLARSLGMSAIAEGVESEEQRRFLQQHGCHQIQGYLMGRPMPAREIADFLRHRCG
jgi:predicted signal transduction protein with EAL and GGDEF domain